MERMLIIVVSFLSLSFCLYYTTDYTACQEFFLHYCACCVQYTCVSCTYSFCVSLSLCVCVLHSCVCMRLYCVCMCVPQCCMFISLCVYVVCLSLCTLSLSLSVCVYVALVLASLLVAIVQHTFVHTFIVCVSYKQIISYLLLCSILLQQYYTILHYLCIATYTLSALTLQRV